MLAIIKYFLSQLSHAKFLLIIYISSLLLLISVSASMDFQKSLAGDSLGYYFEAQLMEQGKLWRSAPVPDGPFHQASVVVSDGKMYGRYFPGQPLILALSEILTGSVYTLILLLSAFNPVLIYLISIRLFKKVPIYVHRLMVLYIILNFDFLLLESNILSHGTATFFGFLGIYLVLVNLESDNKRIKYATALSSVISLMMMFLIRPVDAIIIILPTSIVWFYDSFKNNNKAFLKTFISSIVVIFVFLSLFLLFNKETTGSYFLTPYQKYLPEDGLFKFGKCVAFNPCYSSCLTAGGFFNNLFVNYASLIGLSYLPRDTDSFNLLSQLSHYLFLAFYFLCAFAATSFMFFGWLKMPKEFRMALKIIVIGISIFLFVYSSMPAQRPIFYMHTPRYFVTLIMFALSYYAFQKIKIDSRRIVGLLIAAYFISTITPYISSHYSFFKLQTESYNAINVVLNNVTKEQKSKKLVFVDNAPILCSPAEVMRTVQNYILLVFEFNFDIVYYNDPSLKSSNVVLKYTNEREICDVMKLYPDYKTYIWHIIPSDEDKNEKLLKLDPLILKCANGS